MGKSRKEHRKGMLITSVPIATHFRANYFLSRPSGMKTFKLPLRQLFTFSIDINSSAPLGSFYWLLLWVLWDSNPTPMQTAHRQSSLTKLSVAAWLGSRLQSFSAFEGCNHKHFHRNCWLASCRNFRASCGYHSWNLNGFCYKNSHRKRRRRPLRDEKRRKLFKCFCVWKKS